ncbi:hypothetical protein A3862_04285 [Methylobacterium sp. XJLW]|nr:hypothetical protein A3862_04285 [Methylobacterium sp. XJLW]
MNLLLTLTMINATIGAGILTATGPNPVTVELVAKASGYTITYAGRVRNDLPNDRLRAGLTQGWSGAFGMMSWARIGKFGLS